jgi:hypothetical protein
VERPGVKLMRDYPRLKEYQADARARDVLDQVLPVLRSINQKWDVEEADLEALRRLGTKAFIIIMKRYDLSVHGDAVKVLARVKDSVIDPITGLGYLPGGGEQMGNMLCVEDAIGQITALSA